ncbi:MAG: HPr family phosphocarrier protein, partial [Caulobacteraceae bacterium]
MSASRTVEVVNARGLHARASAKFAKLASDYDAEVLVSREGQSVDGCSIMDLMMLAAGPGATIVISAEGPQAAEAVAALAALVED